MTARDQPVNEFPIPVDLKGFWLWDKMHCPRPMSPFSVDVFAIVTSGFTAAMDEFGCPFGFAWKFINHYAYVAPIPFEDSPAAAASRKARYDETIRKTLRRMGDLWEREWLPSMMPGIDRVRRANYAKFSDEALLAEFQLVKKDVLHRYTIHGKINFVLISAGMFSDFYIETFQPANSTEPYMLLQGFPTRSLDAGRGMWRLSRMVKADPVLRKTFDSVETKGLVRALRKTAEGKTFLTEFEKYLDEFGWRGDAFELADPSWREAPAIPLNAIQGYVLLEEDADPEARYRKAIVARDQLLANARRQLAGKPEVLARFDALYDMARHYLTITENHNFYIDQVGLATVRKVALELGRRLQTLNTLEKADDVFMLHFAEIEEAMAGKDFRTTVGERREELARWARVIPINPIGDPPPPQQGTPDPLVAAIGKMFEVPLEPDRDPNVIRGTAASKGVVQGRARVVRSLAEASKLRKGDIMICEMTMPAWTPLFSTVSALVADTGGVLSHCAIVSREYGLPAVVGTLIGTSVVKDGMLVTVDGTRGIVRIDSRT